MPNGTARKDLEWLKRLLRKHFRHYWRQVAATLEARGRGKAMHARARTIEGTDDGRD